MDNVWPNGDWVCAAPTVKLYSRSFYQTMLFEHVILYAFECPSYNGSLMIDMTTAWAIIQQKTGDNNQDHDQLMISSLSLLHKKILNNFFEQMIQDFSPHHTPIGFTTSMGTCDFILDVSFAVHTEKFLAIHFIVEKKSITTGKKIYLDSISIPLIASMTITTDEPNLRVNDQLILSNSLCCDLTYHGQIVFKGELGKKNDHFAIKILEKVNE
jgi:flagellar motor switch protein FliM